MKSTAASPSRRLQRVAEQLKREVSEIIRRELSVESVGILSVNEVKIAPDLKSATVYVGHVGTSAQRREAPARLAAQAPVIQSAIGSALRLKWTPVLRFLLDDSVEKANRVLAILDELERQAPASPPPPPSGAGPTPGAGTASR